MDKRTVVGITKRYKRAVVNAIGPAKVYLFGSYSKEKATETSDVDLLVDSGLHGLKFLGLSEDIRTALDKDADVFDVSHIEPQSRIDNEIKDTGVVLYEK